jgi:hypothetical protein
LGNYPPTHNVSEYVAAGSTFRSRIPDLGWVIDSISGVGGGAPLGRELLEVIQETQKMASQIQQSSDLWGLEHYLTQRRKEIDRKYDYRYSQLTHVFGRLLHEKRLREEDLRGLREDKLKSIRSLAKFLTEDAA